MTFLSKTSPIKNLEALADGAFVTDDYDKACKALLYEHAIAKSSFLKTCAIAAGFFGSIVGGVTNSMLVLSCIGFTAIVLLSGSFYFTHKHNDLLGIVNQNGEVLNAIFNEMHDYIQRMWIRKTELLTGKNEAHNMKKYDTFKKIVQNNLSEHVAKNDPQTYEKALEFKALFPLLERLEKRNLYVSNYEYGRLSISTHLSSISKICENFLTKATI